MLNNLLNQDRTTEISMNLLCTVPDITSFIPNCPISSGLLNNIPSRALVSHLKSAGWYTAQASGNTFPLSISIWLYLMSLRTILSTSTAILSSPKIRDPLIFTNPK